MGRSKCLSSQRAGRSDSRPQTNSAAVRNKQTARSWIEPGHCSEVRIADMTRVQEAALWKPNKMHDTSNSDTGGAEITEGGCYGVSGKTICIIA